MQNPKETEMQLPESELVFDENTIQSTIDRLALAINDHCADREWLVLCVLNGGLMFTGEVLKRTTFTARLDSVRVTRYHETTSGSELMWHAAPQSDLDGRNILLLDDIFDEGKTLAAIVENLQSAGANEVFTAVLVEKEHDRKVDGFRPDLVGLICPDHYVFGFGMDCEGLYRNLPEIRRLNA
jgi:hypoxanthine phosphoribosyltransferase